MSHLGTDLNDSCNREHLELREAEILIIKNISSKWFFVTLPEDNNND